MLAKHLDAGIYLCAGAVRLCHCDQFAHTHTEIVAATPFGLSQTLACCSFLFVCSVSSNWIPMTMTNGRNTKYKMITPARPWIEVIWLFPNHKYPDSLWHSNLWSKLPYIWTLQCLLCVCANTSAIDAEFPLC